MDMDMARYWSDEDLAIPGHNAAHLIVRVSQEVEGLGDYHTVTEVTHVRDVGTPMLVEDVQVLNTLLSWLFNF